MTQIEKIKKAFEFLKQDCSRVSLISICSKLEIPESCTKESVENELFDHEYQNLNKDYFDDASFWGDIYLQLTDDIYLQFYVTA